MILSLCLTGLAFMVAVNLWISRPFFRGYIFGAMSLGLLGWTTTFFFRQLEPKIAEPGSQIWSSTSVAEGRMIFVLGAFSLLLGAQLMAWAPLRRGTQAMTGPKAPSLDIPFVRLSHLMLAIIIVVLWITSRGLGSLISRDAYISTPAMGSIAALTGALLPLAFLVGLIGFQQGRVLGVVPCVLVVVCSFSAATRLLAVLPILFIVVSSFSRSLSKRTVTVCGALSWLALSIVLALRDSGNGHGLLPYLWAIRDPHLIVTGSSTALSNLAFSVPLAGWVATKGVFTVPDLFISLNPLPGGSSGWTAVAPGLRVHTFIPYNGLGELSSISLWLLLVFLAIFGALTFAVISRSRSVPTWLRASMAGLPVLVFVLLLQYNLRSASRLLYLMVTLLLFSNLVTKKRVESTVEVC